MQKYFDAIGANAAQYLVHTIFWIKLTQKLYLSKPLLSQT